MEAHKLVCELCRSISRADRKQIVPLEKRGKIVAHLNASHVTCCLCRYFTERLSRGTLKPVTEGLKVASYQSVKWDKSKAQSKLDSNPTLELSLFATKSKCRTKTQLMAHTSWRSESALRNTHMSNAMFVVPMD